MIYPQQPNPWDAGAPAPGSPPPGYFRPPTWPPQPPPRKNGRGFKWALAGVAVLLVIAITVGVTLLLTRDRSSVGGAANAVSSPGTKDVVSANDIGPVNVITDEPTCAAWRPIQTALASTQANGFDARDRSSDSSTWSPQVRAQHEVVASAMRNAGDQALRLAKQTPHRVVREMYEQFAVYGRAYAESLSSYQAHDDQLAIVNINLHNAIGGVCDAIDRGGIAVRATAAQTAPPPTSLSPVGDGNRAEQFVRGPNATCAAWVDAKATFGADLASWEGLDRSIPATAWSPERRGVEESASRTFQAYASTIEGLGRQEGGTFEDFVSLAAVYMRAFAATTPTYTVQDSWMTVPGLRLNSAIDAACRFAAS